MNWSYYLKSDYFFGQTISLVSGDSFPLMTCAYVQLLFYLRIGERNQLPSTLLSKPVYEHLKNSQNLFSTCKNS